MRVLIWQVHGSWTTAFVQGAHDYLVPVTPDRGPDGRGRAQTWDWPSSVVEVAPGDAADVDVVVLQRPQEVELVERWFGRRPGRDLPAVYVEHNTPRRDVPDTQHPTQGMPGVALVHVTPFNALMWDNGRVPTHVIEHGVIDPGARWTGEIPSAAVVVNEPVRRRRVAGTDLLAHFAVSAPLDLFGMGADAMHDPSRGIRFAGSLDQDALHDEMARRACYLHPYRWTSLGLSLIEAMMLGMPPVGLATTGAADLVASGAGVWSTSLDDVAAGLRTFVHDHDAARASGDRARALALERFGLRRFLDDWDQVLKEVSA